MDPKIQNLLDKASKLIAMGKFELALQLYLEIHGLDPSEPTFISAIGDLSLRLGKEDDALIWYQKVAEVYESNGRLQNAIAIWKKMVKLSPHNLDFLMCLARLYERSGQTLQAKAQYREMARLMMDRGNLDQVVDLYLKICAIDPQGPENHLELAHVLEKAGRKREAVGAYLLSAELQLQKGDSPGAGSVVEQVFRLCPRDKEFVKRFFRILHQLGLTERGMNLILDLSYDQDPEVKVLLGEALLQGGKVEQAKKILLATPPAHSQLYETTVKLLQELIARGEVKASLDAVNLLLDTSIRLHDEANLIRMLRSVLKLDPSNLRSLRTLTTLQIRMNDMEELEENLRRLAILQLREGDFRGAHDSLNKMVIYGKNNAYLDLLNLVLEANVSESASEAEHMRDQVIRALSAIRPI